MKNLKTLFIAVLALTVASISSCKKEILVETMSTFVDGSAALVAVTNDPTGSMTVQVRIVNIQPDEEVWADINGGQKILGSSGNNMFSRTFETDPYSFPNGNYMANIRIQNKNSGAISDRIESNMVNINWGNSGGGTDTIYVTVYDSIYVVNNDTTYITVHDTVTIGEYSISVNQFLQSNLSTNGLNYFVDLSTNFMNPVACEARIVQNGSNTVLHTYQFSTPMGGGMFSFNDVFGAGNPNTNYKIKIFIIGESTPFFESNVQTLEVGAAQFTFTGVTNIEPNSFTVNYIKTNTSNDLITVDVRDFVGSDESLTTITMSPGDIHVTGSFVVSGYSQNTLVNFEAMINGGLVNSGNEYTDFITYSAIQNLSGTGGTGVQNIVPSQDINFCDFTFTSNGIDTLKSFTIYFQSDSLMPWNYINTIHGVGYALPASLASHWVNMGSGLYKLAVTGLSIQIINGVNTVPLSLISNSYTNNGNFQFSVYVSGKDSKNIIIENSTDKQTTVF